MFIELTTEGGGKMTLNVNAISCFSEVISQLND